MKEYKNNYLKAKCIICAHTSKAILFKCLDNLKIWLPLKFISLEVDNDHNDIVYIPEWIIKQKKLQYSKNFSNYISNKIKVFPKFEIPENIEVEKELIDENYC